MERMPLKQWWSRAARGCCLNLSMPPGTDGVMEWEDAERSDRGNTTAYDIMKQQNSAGLGPLSEGLPSSQRVVLLSLEDLTPSHVCCSESNKGCT